MRRPPLSAVFSPSVSLAVQLAGRGIALGRSRFKAAVLVGHAFGALVECLAVVRRLPLAQIALAVVLRALVVEAVGHLVADDHADAAEVHRRIDLEVEERRLQDAGREVDVVERRAVVGVDGGRRHAPLLLVHRLAQLGVFVVALVNARRGARCRSGRCGSTLTLE